MDSSSCSAPPKGIEEEEYGYESGWVEARSWCDHLGSLSCDLSHIPAPDTPCNTCQHPSENWLCLSCKEVLCSRFVNKHMLHHSRHTNYTHTIALSFSDLSFWCFSCDAYLDPQLIPQLRPLHQLAYILKFVFWNKKNVLVKRVKVRSDLMDEEGTKTKLKLLPLIGIIFYQVSGGPFGVEDSVRGGGGPLLSLLGFLFFPLIWCIPEALVTAELATTFPQNGGYVIWISSAFGPFWGFQEGFLKWLSGVMDNALYPVLFLDYVNPSLPIALRIPALLSITLSLTYFNYRGLHIVGFSVVFLSLFSLSPFLVLALFSIPQIKPSRWLLLDFSKVDWPLYFNTMFWNLNYWDKASTLAGEVEDPTKTFPKALFGGLVLVLSSYLIPLLAGTGASTSSSSPTQWTDGYFAQVGMLIGGSWLKLWIQLAAAISNLGLFQAEMSSDAFQLQGMSKISMLPALFATRSKYGTPTVSILFSATGVIFLSWMSFQEIIELLNFLYAIGMLLEFAAFITLRLKKPNLYRPYRVPLPTFWASMLCLPPALLLILVMCLASLRTFFVSGAVILVGFILYPILLQAKNKNWILFEQDPPSLHSTGWQQCHSQLTDQENKRVELTVSSSFASVEEELSLMQTDSKPS